jgi:hypothetical protein
MASSHDIAPITAAQKTQNFQTAHSGKFKGGKIPESDIREILNQSGCEELRYYFALDDVNKPNEITVCFVGVDASGNDIISGGVMKDSVIACPLNCGTNNALNHN